MTARVYLWPTLRSVGVAMTPGQAWRAWLDEEIDAEEFGRIVNAWQEALNE